MTRHSLFSASAAHRWTQCPGSIALAEIAEPMEEKSSAAAEEGTYLHAVLNWCLEEDKSLEDYAKQHPKEFLTEEQQGAVQECMDTVRATPGQLRFYETEVNYGVEIGQAPEEAFGTLDSGVLDGTTLHIQDAKFGRRHVDAEENLQMILYAIGMVGAIEALGETVDEIVLHILQPRTTSTNAPWTLGRKDLAKRAARMKKQAALVQEARKNPKPGDPKWRKKFLHCTPEACQWCPIKASCPALREVADNANDKAKSASVEEFSDTDLSGALDMVPLLKQFIDAVEHAAKSKLSDGKPVPGYKLIQGRAGARKWKGTEDDTLIVLKNTGVDSPYEKPSLLSPAKAETALTKLIAEEEGITKKKAKEKAKEMLASATTRAQSKPTLVTEDTPGVKWSAGATLEEFD